ncbi:DUF3429 domain-containing protein [Thiothrix subterranea]|uniref:DUF3429 domain-containing protein n=1 Tax=Thiothrix subterranea TaxID=2735563 RepID=UPI00192CAD06|nr:DUF3429 domain-containing protein [Thiothrix subterranea]QQZ27566.1 DUF3429 domain-containing protein [Thiothrix subterranea]
MQPKRALPTVMWRLGYGGLVPFFALTVALLLGMDVPLLESVRLDWWLAAYAALILSFLGAVHWGVALGMQDTLNESELGKLLLFSVVPSVLAWFALLLPIQWALFVLAGLVVFAYVVDALLLFDKLSSSYGKMRLHLTVIVALLLVAAGVAVQ